MLSQGIAHVRQHPVVPRIVERKGRHGLGDATRPIEVPSQQQPILDIQQAGVIDPGHVVLDAGDPPNRDPARVVLVQQDSREQRQRFLAVGERVALQQSCHRRVTDRSKLSSSKRQNSVHAVPSGNTNW